MIADEDIIAICERECGWLAGAKDAELIKFARAIEAATAPNAKLVEALQLVVDRFGPSESDYIFSKRFALKKARAALASAGVEVAK